MAKKGIDSTFLHYGIRTSDMDIIQELCTSPDFQLNPDWVKDEILKLYNEGGNDQGVVEEKTIRQIIKNALKKI
jgi:hypothetical protein